MKVDHWFEDWRRREDEVMRMHPYCPRCGTQQVQIVGKKVPAEWKCRSCKLRFDYEAS